MTTYELHLIATHPSHGDQHLNPVSPRLLGTFATEAEAQDAGRAYLRANPSAWLQTQDDDQREPGRDVDGGKREATR